jgi:cellulose biosynthesis protein BcsQ
MAIIALYSPKGGVGKTTLAVNLAWSASVRCKRRVLLWDLDPQAAASFILAPDRKAHDEARAILEKELEPERLIQQTPFPQFDLLPADISLRALDAVFVQIDRKKRLLRLTEHLHKAYDHIILDCPPGLGVASDQIIRGADLILAPMIPSTLSRRAFAELRAHLDQMHKGGPPTYPVFNMVDRRRRIHRAAMENDPGCPVIPMSSAVEAMADRHSPLGSYMPKNPAAVAVDRLWKTVERSAGKVASG